ncbi:VOC family protein [Enterococcus wangshanyuanii]|uniref:Glyoxalase n=1 Tax=Enterococcus wangshanyuanii TaxID=2005703 RepID=A0ABQ1NJA7_9ENTE|nr:VOC family protein [Enterococcus wangshanyuanii]GGC78661.1 glyoxalase [Enterococcus wangshanyuanii]
MEKFKLSKDVYVETVAIRIKDVETMVSFYKNVLGFVLKLEENNLSIFGSQKRDSRLLILEEAESEQVERTKSSICFSLLIPTLEEFSGLLRRITVHDYPITRAIQKDGRKSVFLSDPEGNDIAITYNDETGLTRTESQELDIQRLIKSSKVLYTNLSPEVRLDQVKLYVDDRVEHYHFYQEILGMVPKSNSENTLAINDHNFFIHLEHSEDLNEQRNEKETLGIDFFVLNVDHEEEMIRLKGHLEKENQEFFIDNKRKILTIYDPSHIEWWFVRN